MTYSVEIRPAFRRELKKLPKLIQTEVEKLMILAVRVGPRKEVYRQVHQIKI